jgi:hypothetical protein
MGDRERQHGRHDERARCRPPCSEGFAEHPHSSEDYRASGSKCTMVSEGNWATTTIFKGDVRPDFVIFVWFNNPKVLDACRIFVVPADVVESALRDSHEHWHKFNRRDGLPRKKSKHTAFTWTGKPTVGNIGRGFAEKWAKYEDAWDLLSVTTAGPAIR